jgi:hypothetical protein
MSTHLHLELLDEIYRVVPTLLCEFDCNDLGAHWRHFVNSVLSTRRRRRSAAVFIRHTVPMACSAHDKESLLLAVVVGD